MQRAVVHISMLAVETFSAECLDINSYPISFAESLDFTAQFFHSTHHLMPDGNASHSSWYAAMPDVQVTCAEPLIITRTMASVGT